MASEATSAEPEAMEPKAPSVPQRAFSPLSLVVEMAFLTCFAIGAGGLFGMLVLGGERSASSAPAPVEATHAKKPRQVEAATLRSLPAIVTNLAGPQRTWIRLEASIVMGDPSADANAIAASIAEDVVAYLRTVPLAQIEGPSGFLHLREDLNDRARVRSAGKARELVIQSLVIE